MTVLKVLHVPDPRLKVKAQPVERVDDEIRRLMDDMVETMYANDGVGLAAIQVAVPKRVIVMDCARDPEPPCPMKLANPELTWLSPEIGKSMEGCLSVPDQFADVMRSNMATVRYLDENNQVCEKELTGLWAQAVQHEIDHLNGILFIDHLSSLKRELLLRKAIKADQK